MVWSVLPLKAFKVPAVPSLKNLDPYLVWSLLNGLSKEPGSGGDGIAAFQYAVLLQFRDRSTLTSCSGGGGKLSLMPTHFHSVQSEPQRTRWRSCLVDAHGLGTLIRCAANASAGVERFELSEARLGLVSVDLARGGKAPFRDGDDVLIERLDQGLKVLLQSSGKPGVGATPTKRQRSASLPLVCVIDDRCNFASSSLRGPNGAIVSSIWLQGNDPCQLQHLDDANGVTGGGGLAAAAKGPTYWYQPLRWRVISLPLPAPALLNIAGAVHGRFFPTDKLFSTTADTSAATHEPQAYRTVAYLNPTYRWSHGSAILDLVAGRLVWGTRRPGQWSEPRKHSRDTAPPRVCFVQLPSETVADTSGGSLGSHVLDGIHHALEEADDGQALIVNVSYGTHSGPHDGTSLFELALKELLDFYSGSDQARGKTLHVVLPAGNSHLWRCHASGWLTGRGATAKRQLLWKVMPDNADPSFIEIWLPFGQAVSITVTSPNGETVTATPSESGGLWGFKSPGADASLPAGAALIWPPSVPQGQKRTMALLAVQASMPRTAEPFPMISPTAANKSPCEQPRRSRPTQPGLHGVWTIDLVKAPDAAALRFDAWVQRADAAPGRGPQMRGHRGRQSYLLETKDCHAVASGDGDVDPRCTMNGIATLKHERLYVVGAMRRSDGSISHYSAGGPNADCDQRFDGPDWVVPADESFNNPGLLTTGVLSGSRQRVPGTSMAAAAFTRLLYEHLARHGSADGLCGPAPEWPTRLPKQPCGAPHHADAMHRGECVRLMPSNADGTLSFPCVADARVATCGKPR